MYSIFLKNSEKGNKFIPCGSKENAKATALKILNHIIFEDDETNEIKSFEDMYNYENDAFLISNVDVKEDYIFFIDNAPNDAEYITLLIIDTEICTDWK